MKKIKLNIFIYIVLLIVFLASSFEIYLSGHRTFVSINKPDYSEPALPANIGTWGIQSIDTQIISKNWPNVSQESIAEQIKLLKNLGVNYVAVDTPYDRVGELRMWATTIHREGLHVWFRSHWDKWEGDDGQPATMTPQEYLDSTRNFIKTNPDLFLPGDSFTAAVEPEQVGVGLGERFLNWDDYRKFLLSEVQVANDSFSVISLKGKIYTNWISVNGWVVQNQFTASLVKNLGLITVDHYVDQNRTIGDFSDAKTVVQQTVLDFDSFHNKWNVPIMVGEWGYQIYQTVPDNIQADVVNRMYAAFKSRPYIIGINYWAHMGNTASIIGDQFGANLRYRPAALIIKSYYFKNF